MEQKLPGFFEDKFRIRTYEIDHTGRATLISIQQYLQEVAVEHAMKLKVSMYELFPQGLTWVLSRLHIKVQRYPKLHETVRVKTWPSGRSSLFATRDFEIWDSKETKICTATTSWMLIYLKNKRPARIDKHILELPVHPVRALPDDFPQLPKLTNPAFEKRFYARLSDLDLNQHVNNIAYIAWCLEAIPREYWDTHQLTEIEVNFKAESFYGDSIHSRCAPAPETDGIFYHHLIRETDNKELARSVTHWKPYKQGN